jgi:tRNA U34 5-carboxymethylaminomethyl modifying GTPase MnmE/TrmE
MGQGLAELRAALSEKIHACHKHTPAHQVAISERHFRLLQAAKNEVAAAADFVGTGADDGVPLAADRLRGALEHLGLITGRVYHSELLESIFSRFCIGK